MHFPSWVITGIGAILAVQGIGLNVQADPPATRPAAPRQDAPPLPGQIIILKDATDLEEFWKRLDKREFVIIKPGPEQARPGAREPSEPQPGPKTYVVNSVKVRGEINGETANLTLELELGLLSAEPVWVPVRLDNQILISAREEGRELRLRNLPSGQWEVYLDEKGPHRLRIELKAPVKANPERKQLELAIPLAPSTSVEIDVAQPVFEVDLGANQKIGQSPLPGGKGSRISAHLPPQSKLLLSWSDVANPEARQTPLLIAQGEIAIDVGSEAVTTRSSWAIRCVRGIAHALEIRLDDEDVVSKLQLDDQVPLSGIEHVKGANLLTIPLGDPLRPGNSRRLVMETRRPLPSGGDRNITFSGFPLTHAREQFGAMGITQSANLWVNPTTAQGLRRIDPRDLPAELKTRPSTSLAFQFQEQPFNLGLGIESSPPLFRTEGRTRLVLDSEIARNETTIEIQRVRGNLFEVEVEVGASPDLQLVSVGPPDVVESTSLASPDPADKSGGAARSQIQVLKIRLTPLGRDQKSITLQLKGQQRIRPNGDVKLGLFSPRGAVSTSRQYALLAERNLTLDLLDDPGQISRSTDSNFKVKLADDRSWSSWGTSRGAPLLLLQSNRNPASIRVRVTHHDLSITHDTALEAKVGQRWIDVRQESDVRVRYGSVNELIVRVPTAGSEPWELQSKEPVKREDLGPEPGGKRRFRLVFERPIQDRSSLVFRYRVPIAEPIVAGASARNSVPWIAIGDKPPVATTLEISAEPGIELTLDDPAWAPSTDREREESEGRSVHYFRPRPGGKPGPGFQFGARLLEPVPLPTLLAPRVLLRSSLGSDDIIRTHAWYWIESHQAYIPFSLPNKTRWMRARIDGRTAAQLEYDPNRSSYRLNLPAESSAKPVLVELEYQMSRADAGQGWGPPQLDEGGEVLQVLWQIQLPWNLALIGVPQGWADENQWYWDIYVWKRRPWKSLARLVGWVIGSSSQSPTVESLGVDDREDSHAYLFRRAGRPVPLRVWVASRAWIVAVCSGTVLAAGFILMFSRIRFRMFWAVAATLCLLAAILVHSSVVFLALQSGFTGGILALLGLFIHHLLERGKSREPQRAEPGPPSAQSVSGSSLARAMGVGSDDSTAIRVRVSSTLDYVASPAASVPEREAGRSSQIERLVD